MSVVERLTRDEVIEQNQGLVHACAHRFKGKGIEYDDLFQAGCMGLVKATDGFDYNRGVKFSTYAVPVILGEMRRLFRDGGAIKVSRSIKELSIKINRLREKHALKNDVDLSIAEIAYALEVSHEDVVEALNVCAAPMSLTESEDLGNGQFDIPVESEDVLLSDLIALRQLLGHLSDEDRTLITKRYFQNKTQAVIAKEMGMTQVQVSRREKKILEAMRKELI